MLHGTNALTAVAFVGHTLCNCCSAWCGLVSWTCMQLPCSASRPWPLDGLIHGFNRHGAQAGFG